MGVIKVLKYMKDCVCLGNFLWKTEHANSFCKFCILMVFNAVGSCWCFLGTLEVARLGKFGAVTPITIHVQKTIAITFRQADQGASG